MQDPAKWRVWTLIVLFSLVVAGAFVKDWWESGGP